MVKALSFHCSGHGFDAWSGASQVVLVVKNPPANAGDIRDMGSIPGLGRSPGGGHGNPLQYSLGTSLVAQTVKNLPAMQETWVQSLGREDPLEKGMATFSSTLAWRIPWTEEPGGLQSMGLQESDTTEQLTHTVFPFLEMLR